MRSEDPRAMVAEFLRAGGGGWGQGGDGDGDGDGGGGGSGGSGACGGGAPPPPGGRLWPAPLLAKVCGVKDVASALAAARAGANVTLVGATGGGGTGDHIGGMVTGGLQHTDCGNASVIGGIAREFF